ncbi:MAG: LytR C-terminal domain-containing protein [Solirubrobacteraceae bacterium]
MLLAAVALLDQIERFGSYFGYAAVIGLGVLSLLYFSQAREVRRLREWAGRAPERDAEMAQRVQSDAQRRAVAQLAPAASGGTQSAAPQTAAAQQAEAARRAAAASVMPKVQPPGTGAAPPAVGPPGQLARPAGLGGASPPPAPAPAPGSPAASAATVPPPGATPGAPAAPTGAVAAARQAATPGRSPASINGAGGQDTHESPAARPSPLPDLPPRTARAASSAPPPADAGGISGRRIGLIGGGVCAVLAAAVGLTLLLTGGGDTPSADNAIRDTPPPPAASSPFSSSTSVDRKATQVAVLNGTTQTGLASAVSRTIEGKGFTMLPVDTNPDQEIATTTVSYVPGSGRAARIVARTMEIGATAVQPIDTDTATVASSEAKVVVLVGSDKSDAG